MVTSTATLVLPKSVCQVVEMALTVHSPGSITTPAAISMNTPKPSTRQPNSRERSWRG